MKTDLNITISVGLTNELTGLITRLCDALEGKTFKIENAQPTSSNTAQQITTETKEVENEKPSTNTNDATPEKVKSKKEINAPEEARRIMHETRQRFEGEDYKNNTQSEEYKKYHKALNVEFIRIANVLGADKPSLLTAEKIYDFQEACARLEILDDGKIGTPKAF